MQQIRCGLCGRQTLVDPQSPGTCPSCGFPLSVPAEAAEPDSVSAAASAADVSGPSATVAASPAEPAAAVAPLAVGPIVTDPAPLVTQPETGEQEPVPAGRALVLGPVVSDPAPAVMSPSELPPAAASVEASAIGPEEAQPVAAAAYVPPVPETHAAWQDVSDAADSGVAIPVPAADDIYAPQPHEPAQPDPAAAVSASEPDMADAAANPELAVQPPRFDMSDAAITTVAEPSAVVEDIYITQMAEPAGALPPEPAAAEPVAVVEPAVAAEEAAPADAAWEEPAAEPPVAELEEQATMPAPEVPAAEASAAEASAAPTIAEPAEAVMVAEATTQVAEAPIAPERPVVPDEPPPAAAPQPQPQQQEPAAQPGYTAPGVPLPGQYPYAPPPPPPPQQPPAAPYPYGAQQPAATAPYPQPYPPASPGMPMGPMSPMSQMPPPPKKSRIGLIVALIIVGVVVLALIAAAIVGLLLVQPAGSVSGGSVALATPTAAPVTPTTSIPAGFAPYTGTDGSFSLNVPSAWTQNASSSPNSKVIDFTAPDNTGRLRVAVIPGTVGSQGQKFEDLLFGVVLSNGKVSNKQGPTSVAQAGETWTQESADVSNNTGTLHVVAYVTTHGGNTYTVLYLAAPDTFTSLESQYFQPMFTSLQFLQ